MRAWRLYLVIVGVAALSGTVISLALSGGLPQNSRAGDRIAPSVDAARGLPPQQSMSAAPPFASPAVHDPPPLYEMPPQVFGDLRVMAPADARAELLRSGEYHAISVERLCGSIGCTHTANGPAHTVGLGDVSVRWVRGERVMRNNAEPAADPITLPTVPQEEGGDVWFPIRILTEYFGFNTRFDTKTGSVSVFRLHAQRRFVDLRLERTITGSDLPFSYFLMAYDTPTELLLLYDLSSELIRFRKPDFSFEKIGTPDHDIIRHFAVMPDRTVLAATTTALLALRGDHFEVAAGGGTQRPERAADRVPFRSFRAKDLHRLVSSPDGRFLYAVDQNDILAFDLRDEVVTLLLPASVAGSVLHVATYHDRIVIGTADRIRSLDPATGTITESACFARLFAGRRIYGIRYLDARGLWIVLDSGARDIVEARLTFDDEVGDCAIVRRTALADQTSFLNGFGTIVGAEDRLLVIDSDGFNLVRYDVGGSYSLLRASDLSRQANLRWLGPFSIAERDGWLYVVANLSHRVYRYRLSDGYVEAYAGNSSPARDEQPTARRTAIGIGYPLYARFVNDQLWIGDYQDRRILVVNGDTASALYPPPEHTYMGGVSGFAPLGAAVVIADQSTGLVFSLAQGAARPERLAGVFDAHTIQDSEGARRAAARSSVEQMIAFDSVAFGLPVSVESLGDGRIVVADVYRQGIWLLDPATRSVEPAAGLNSHADYHFGSFVGNAGLSARELRIASPYVLTHDPLRRAVTVPTGYGKAIVFLRDDLRKTCVGRQDVPFEQPTHALFLADGRLAVVDFALNRIYLFYPPDLSCLRDDAP